MTNTRALYGALASAALILMLGTAANAGESVYTLTGTQSKVDGACVVALPRFTSEDCTYNNSNPTGLGPVWVGPVVGASYYEPGDSPFAVGPGLPAPTTPSNDKAELEISGTLTIEDNETLCTGDDTIAGEITLAAGTRAFAGGPGTFGEESWGDDTIVFVIPETTVDEANSIAAGCEYIIGSAGFPDLITTDGGQTYPADAVIASSPDVSEDAWTAPASPGVSSIEGNNGVQISLKAANFSGGSYQCRGNADISGPSVTSACNNTGSSVAGPCQPTGSNFCGVRNPQQNWVLRIVVDPGGDIVEPALIFANNESVVIDPPTAAINSWDGPLMTFTASCDNCSIAKNDTYNFVTGTTNAPIDLNVGANDDPAGAMGASTTLNVSSQPSNGTVAANGTSPGAVQALTATFTSSDGFASQQLGGSFMYDLDDGVTDPGLGLEATVTVNVFADAAPDARAYTVAFDTQGISPATLRDTTDIIADAGGDAGNNGTVSITGGPSNGTAEVDGFEITYDPDDDLFTGADSFTYEITDNNFGSPGVGSETSGATVTIDIPNVVPTIADDDQEASTEAGIRISFDSAVTLGNGSVAQHVVGASADNGDCEVTLAANGTSISGTYTPDDGFENNDDECVFTLTDENGGGDTAEGVVVITVTGSTIAIKVPGSSAVDPWSLALLLFAPLFKSRRRGALLAAVVSLFVTTSAMASIVTITGGVRDSWSTQGINSGEGLILESGVGPGYACDGLRPPPPPDTNTGPATCAEAGVPEQWGMAVVYGGQFDSESLEGSLTWTGEAGNESGTGVGGAGSGLFVSGVTDGSYDFQTGAPTGVFACWNSPSRLLANFCGNSSAGATPTVPQDISSVQLRLGITNYTDLNNGTIRITLEDNGFTLCQEAAAPGPCTDNGASNKQAVWTLTATGTALATAADDTFDVQLNSVNNVLPIGANDINWFDEAGVTQQQAGSSGGTFVINDSATPGAPGNVTVTYTPAPNVGGTETWKYRVTDTTGPNNPNNTDVATVTINVYAEGAHDDQAMTNRFQIGDAPLASSVAIPVGANDYGFVGDTTLTIDTPPTNGAVTIQNNGGPANGIEVTYTPTGGVLGYGDTFSYSLADSNTPVNNDVINAGGEVGATVNIFVNNEIPVANDLAGVTLDTQGVDPATVSTTVNVFSGGDIAGNSFGDQPTVVTTAASANGAVTTSVASSFITIQANAFASAGDTFAYQIKDANGETATGSIGVVITDVSPAVQDVGQDVAFTGAVTITVPFALGNGTVADHSVAQPTPLSGTVSNVMINAGSPNTVTFDYTPNGLGATDVFSVVVSDGDGSPGTGMVTVRPSGGAVKFPTQETLPGSSSALGPLSLLALLIGAPLLRRRRRA